MSVSAEIARLNSAKSDIASAITEKGVSVPVGTKLDGMAPLIREISSGGWIGDGNTHIWIHLEDGRTSPMLGCCLQGSATVDWGDKTAKDTLTGESMYFVTWTSAHHYAEPGDYIITLSSDVPLKFYGYSDDGKGSCILCYSSGADNRNAVYQASVEKIEFGNSAASIGSYAFRQCWRLASVTIPNSVTTIGSQAFYTCYGLASATIGSSYIENSAFLGCTSLTNITFSSNLENISNFAFSGCKGARYYDFTLCSKVPRLSHTNAFEYIPSDCEIRVPKALYNDWKSATNWSTYASKIVAV